MVAKTEWILILIRVLLILTFTHLKAQICPFTHISDDSLFGLKDGLDTRIKAGSGISHADHENAIRQDVAEMPSMPAIISLGQPPQHRYTWGLVIGPSFKYEHLVSRLFVNEHSRIVLPQAGAINITLEGAVERRGKSFAGALGIFTSIFGARSGIEWDFQRKNYFIRFSTDIVLRRGGLFGHRERLRLDYLPATETVQIGLTLHAPWQKLRKNRPKDKYVRLPKAKLPPEEKVERFSLPSREIQRIYHSLEWMDKLLTPRLTFDIIDSKRERKKFERIISEIQAHVQEKCHSFTEEDSIYHASLVSAFTSAMGGNKILGADLARKAEEIILDQLILPVNRLFGQKKKPFHLGGFIKSAWNSFEDYLNLHERSISPTHKSIAKEIFRRILYKIEEISGNAKRRWKDERLVWLPLNYGLRPDQYDSQPELNQVLERLIGRRFSNAHQVRYLLNDRWYYELERMILETHNYHVLIIHDFAGTHGKVPDYITWSLVVNGYIEAFIRAIELLDRGERDRLPQFMIFLDEHYYQLTGGRKVMRFLENLHRPTKIRLKNKTLEKMVRGAHERLLSALAGSRILQDMSMDHLKKMIKVHVNITNTYQPTFTEDMVMRDHRKIAFRDVFEDDPSSGVAIFTGQGVGEAYIGPCWDDRSIMIQGPDLVHLKTSTRELFLSQGFHLSDVPYYLRPREFPQNYQQLCENLRQMGWTASVMNIMNATGFGKKIASVVKAALYNLMLPGSVIVAPDSIWTCDFWTGMFVGAALRGCQVYPIAPAGEHAPSNAPFTLELMRNTLTSMLRASQLLSEEIKESGGVLRIGLYTKESDVHDLKAGLGTFIEGIERDEHLRGRFAVHPSLVEAVNSEFEKLREETPRVKHLGGSLNSVKSCQPKMHFKAQFFAGRKGIEILQQEGWGEILKKYFGVRREEVSGEQKTVSGVSPSLFRSVFSRYSNRKNQAGTVENLRDSSVGNKAEEEIFVLVVGSHNQDRRSMMLDGEAMVVLTESESLICLIDFALLLGSATWVSTVEEIKARYPAKQSMFELIAKWIKDLI